MDCLQLLDPQAPWVRLLKLKIHAKPYYYMQFEAEALKFELTDERTFKGNSHKAV